MVLFFLAATVSTVSAACVGAGKSGDVKMYEVQIARTKKTCALPTGENPEWTDSCGFEGDDACDLFGKNNQPSCKKQCTAEIKCNFFAGNADKCKFFEICPGTGGEDVFDNTMTTYRKVCKGAAAPTAPPTSVCEGASGPKGSMIKRCTACLSDAKYTSESCEFNKKTNQCSAPGTVMMKHKVTDPANCPAKGANKKGGANAKKPKALPPMCNEDPCCKRGKASGAAILQSAGPPKVFRAEAEDEFECAAMCTEEVQPDIDCEWWTFDKKAGGSCTLYTTAGKKTAAAPADTAKNMKSRRYISGDSSCKPMPAEF